MRAVRLICGPPCAGKSTYVQRLAAPDDDVLDFDDIAGELGSPGRWMHPAHIMDLAEDEMRRRIDLIAADPNAQAWVIRSLPDAHRRASLAERLGASVVVIDPGMAECLRRSKITGRPSGTTRAIRTWYWAASRGLG